VADCRFGVIGRNVCGLVSGHFDFEPGRGGRTCGLPPALLEIVPALLFSTALNGLAFALLAFGAHMPSQSAEVAPAGPADAQVSVSQCRAEQVRSFVGAYRKRHGRDPSFSDVRNSPRAAKVDRVGLSAKSARLTDGLRR